MSGRATRMEWWVVFPGALFAGAKVLNWVYAGFAVPGQTLQDTPFTRTLPMGLAAACTVAVVITVQIKVSIKRAQDYSARSLGIWVWVAAYVGVLTAQFLAAATGIEVQFSWAKWAVVAIFGWLGLTLGMRRGDAGPNRCGPPPKPFFQMDTSKTNNYRPPR